MSDAHTQPANPITPTPPTAQNALALIPSVSNVPITSQDITTHTYLTALLASLYPSSPPHLLLSQTSTCFRAAVTAVEGKEDAFRVPPQKGAARTEALQKVIDVLEQKAEVRIRRVEGIVRTNQVKMQERNERLEKRQKEERERQEREGNVSPEVKREGDGAGGVGGERHGDVDMADAGAQGG